MTWPLSLALSNPGLALGRKVWKRYMERVVGSVGMWDWKLGHGERRAIKTNLCSFSPLAGWVHGFFGFCFLCFGELHLDWVKKEM